ncbi:unnamed protein product [Paramecium sonneborni]|uniref:Uncharacterized protein n=1 Tax=Paramecium sonneborni TaxID=65129 RepID=A0A8S1Q3V2_9CILI|nr:unnamed protein product [Paramecium sonneborni]
MIPKVIQLIDTLFDNVDQLIYQSQTLSNQYQRDVDFIVDQIKNELGHVNPNIIRNYSFKIIELQSINTAVQQIKISLDIFFNIPSNPKKKKAYPMYQDGKLNISRIKSLIHQQIQDLKELSEIQDVENYQENEFDKICIFRLSQIYQNQIDDLHYQFQQEQIKNNQHFNILNEKYQGIINDKIFIKISCQIQNYEILMNLIDDYRDNLFEVYKNKIVQSESTIYKSKSQTQSLLYKSTSSLELIEEHYQISSRQHPLFKYHKQDEIKNKKSHSNPEVCVKCIIF